MSELWEGLRVGCLRPVSGSRRLPGRRGVLSCPLERVVGDFLPAVLPDDVVGAAGELLVVGYALGVAVVLGVGLIDSGRHDVVFAPRYEEQGRPVFVGEVEVVLL